MDASEHLEAIVPKPLDAEGVRLRQNLEDVHEELLLSILALEEELKSLTQTIEQCASPQRPKGMGALTLEQIEREVCDWKRFKNRKSLGSYAGLTGGVSASGDSDVRASSPQRCCRCVGCRFERESKPVCE